MPRRACPAGRRRGRQRGDRGRHQALAARLVDRAGARLDDVTSSPARAACSAVARPAGPPPATSRSITPVRPVAPARRSRRAAGRASSGVEHREHGGRDPGRVHQRQRETLDHDGHVVRMAEHRYGPAVTRGSPGTTITRVFHCRPERARCTTSAAPARRAPRRASASRAPARTAGRRPTPRRRSRPAAGVQRHHDRVVPRPCSMPPRRRLQAALRLVTTSSASRSSPTSDDSDGDQPTMRSRRTSAESTSSAQKPGPIASSSPGVPAGGGRFAIVSLRTCSTEADERLPTSAGRQVSSSASSPRPRASWTASSTFGPPGWHTHQSTSVIVRPWSARKPRRRRRDITYQVGHLGVEHDPEPAVADVPAHRALGAGVEPAAGGQHLGAVGEVGRACGWSGPTPTSAAAPSLLASASPATSRAPAVSARYGDGC